MDGHLNFSREHSRLLASSGLHPTHSFSMEATHPHGSTMRTAFADLGRPSTGVAPATADPTALTAAALQSRFLSAALPFSSASSFPFLGGMLTSSMPASPSSPFRTPPASVANMRQFWPPTPPPDGYGRFNMSGNFYNLLPSMGSLVPPSADSLPYSSHGMISRLAPSTHYHHLLDAHKDSSYFSPNLNLGAPLTPTTLVPPLSSFSPALDRQSTFGHLSPGVKGAMDGGRRHLGGAEESGNANNSFWRVDAELEGFLKREPPSRHSSTERSSGGAATIKQQEPTVGAKEVSKNSRNESKREAEARKASSGTKAGNGCESGATVPLKACKSREAKAERKVHYGGGNTTSAGVTGENLVRCSSSAAMAATAPISVEGLPAFANHPSKPVDSPASRSAALQLPATSAPAAATTASHTPSTACVSISLNSSIPTEQRSVSEPACSRNSIGGGHYPPVSDGGTLERRVPTSAALGVSKVVESQTPPVVTMTTTEATSNSTKSATAVTYSTHAPRIQEPRDCRPSSEKQRQHQQQIRAPTTATPPVLSSPSPVLSLPSSLSSSSSPVIGHSSPIAVPHSSSTYVQNAPVVSVKCSCASSPKPTVQPTSRSVSDAVVHKNSVNSSSVQCSKACTVTSTSASQQRVDAIFPLSTTSCRTSSEPLASAELHGHQPTAVNLTVPPQIVSSNSSGAVGKTKVNRKEVKRNSPVPHGVASVYTSQQWTHQSVSESLSSRSYSSWDMGNPCTPQCPKVNAKNLPQISSQCCKNTDAKNLSGAPLPVVSGKSIEKSFSVDAIKLKKESDERRQDCQFAQKSQFSLQRLTGTVCSESLALRPNIADSDDNNCAINLTVGNKIPKTEPKDFSLCSQHNQPQQLHHQQQQQQQLQQQHQSHLPQPQQPQKETSTVVEPNPPILQKTSNISVTAVTSSSCVSSSSLSSSMSTISDSRGSNRQKNIVQGSPISWIAPQVHSRASPSNVTCYNKPIATAVQSISTVTTSQKTTGRAVKEVHSTISAKHTHSAKTHAPITIKSNLSNRARTETTISRLCRNATISSTLDGSVKIATPGGEVNMLQQSAKTTTITLPGGVVAATGRSANTSIPIGIAVAQQRQDPSNTAAGVKHNLQPPGSTDNLQRFSEARPLENSNVCDQNDLVRSQKPPIQEALNRPTQAINDSTNCLVSTGTALQSNQWESDAVTRTTLPTQWVTHTPVVTPTVWVGQGAYAAAPTNTATTVPTVSLGPLDTSHLSIPPGGYQLARDPITCQLFLIPTANIVSHTELVDRTSMWSTYTSTSAPVHLQQLVTQPQQQTQFQQQIVAQMETGKLQVTELTESTVCTITVSDTVEGRDRERESQQSQELVAKRESKDTKAVGTSPSTLITGIPIATGQPFTYSAFPAPAPAPAVSYYYEPTVVHLTQNQATTAIQTEPGKRSQGTSPLNPATPSPPLQIASEQGVQTCSLEDNLDDLEEFDECDRETHTEVTHVKLSDQEMGVTTATQVDFDAQTSSEDNDFEERKVEVQDSANQTESPLIGTPKDENDLMDENSIPFEPVEQESVLTVETQETKPNETNDDIPSEKDKCLVTDDAESAPILPAESEPVMEFIDHHGLNLLVDSIEEFTAREQEAQQESKAEIAKVNESQKEASDANNLPIPCDDKEKPMDIQPAPEPAPPTLPRLDPGCTDGLGLLCALAEQRFIEESLNAQQNKEMCDIQSEKPSEKLEKAGSTNSLTKLDINSNYQPVSEENGTNVLPKTSASQVQGIISSSSVPANDNQSCPPSSENSQGPAKVEMKVRLAELQRKYKRKQQKELVKPHPQKDEKAHEMPVLLDKEGGAEPPEKKKRVEDTSMPQINKDVPEEPLTKKPKQEEPKIISKVVITGSQYSTMPQLKVAKSDTSTSEVKQRESVQRACLALSPTSMPSSATPKSSGPNLPSSIHQTVTTTLSTNNSRASENLPSTLSTSTKSSSEHVKKEQVNNKPTATISEKTTNQTAVVPPKTKTQHLKSSQEISKKSVDNKKKVSNTQINVKSTKPLSIALSLSVKKVAPSTEKDDTNKASSTQPAEPVAKEIKDQEQPQKKGVKRPAEQATSSSSKQLKTATPRSKDSTETKAKKTKTDESNKKNEPETKTPLFPDDAWNRRRSERIFLHDAGVVPQSSVASYNDIPVIGQKQNTSPTQSRSSDSASKADGNSSTKGSKPTSKANEQSSKAKKPKQQPKKEVAVVKKVKTKEVKETKEAVKTQEKEQKEAKQATEQDASPSPPKKNKQSEAPSCSSLSSLNSDGENIEASSSEGENIPLSALVDRYASELRSSTVTLDDLKDNQRVLTLVDGLFYAGAISAIQPPDIYGIVLDGERGNRPRIYSQEEILKEAILEIKPTSMKHLPEGCRICAYWSQQYRCLYPGTVAKATSPNPATDKNLVYVEFDDGDSGKIPLEDIRLLPSNYPVVDVEPNPLLLLGKRRQRTGESTESKTSSTDCTPPAQSSEKLKVKKFKKQAKSSKKKTSNVNDESKQDDSLSDDVFHSKPSKGQQSSKHSSSDKNSLATMTSTSSTATSLTSQTTTTTVTKSVTKSAQRDPEKVAVISKNSQKDSEKGLSISKSTQKDSEKSVTITKASSQKESDKAISIGKSSQKDQEKVISISKSSQKDSEKTVSKKKSKKSKNDSKTKSKDKCHDKCPKGDVLGSSQDGKSKKHKKHKEDHKHRHRRHHRHCRHRHRHKKHKHEKKNSLSTNDAHIVTPPSSLSPVVNSTFSTVTLSSSVTPQPLALTTSSSSSSSRSLSSSPSTNLLLSSPSKSPPLQKSPPEPKNQPEVSKKSELTVKIKTGISNVSNELTCASEPVGTKEQKCKTAVVINNNDSSSDSSSDSSDSSDSSEDEAPSSEAQVSSKTLSTSQKQKTNKSSPSQKPAKRRDRIPSVEKSKIAAFLPARQLWRWSGKSFRRPGTKGKAKKEFYKEITRGKETIKVGDSAVFLSTGRPHLPYIGRIETMWQSWGGNMVVKVRWFYHPEETKGEQRLSDPKGALFESPHMDENDVQTISHKCEVLSWEDYNKHKEQEAQQGSIYGSIFDNNDIYYLAGTYDPTVGVIVLKPGIS